MIRKIYTQLFLIFLLAVITLFLFFKYFKKTNIEDDLRGNIEQSINTTDSLIENLKYLSTDKEGNEYKIEAKKGNLQQLKVKDIMTKNPISINADGLAAKALSLMHSRRITFLCVHKKKKNKTIGVIHIHNILENNIQ